MSDNEQNDQLFIEKFKEAMLVIYKQNPGKWYNY